MPPPHRPEDPLRWWQAPCTALVRLCVRLTVRWFALGETSLGALAALVGLSEMLRCSRKPGDVAGADAAQAGAALTVERQAPAHRDYTPAEVAQAQTVLDALRAPSMPRYLDIHDASVADDQRLHVLIGYYPSLRVAARCALDTHLRDRISQILDPLPLPADLRVLLQAVPRLQAAHLPQPSDLVIDARALYDAIGQKFAGASGQPAYLRMAVLGSKEPTFANLSAAARGCFNIQPGANTTSNAAPDADDVAFSQQLRIFANGRETVETRLSRRLERQPLSNCADPVGGLRASFSRLGLGRGRGPFKTNKKGSDATLIDHFLRPQASSVAKGELDPGHSDFDGLGTDLALHACIRLAELTSGLSEFEPLHGGLKRWLCRKELHDPGSPQRRVAMLWLAAALQVDSGSISVLPEGRISPVSLTTAVMHDERERSKVMLQACLPDSAEQEGSYQKVSQRLDLLARLLHPVSGADLGVVINLLQDAPGAVFRWADMGLANRTEFARAISQDDHIGLAAIGCALWVDDVASAWVEVTKALTSHAQSETPESWCARAQILRGYSAPVRRYVLADVSTPCGSTQFRSFLLRQDLLDCPGAAAPEVYANIIRQHIAVSAIQRAQAVLGLFQLNREQRHQPAALLPILRHLHQQNLLTTSAMRAVAPALDAIRKAALQQAKAQILNQAGDKMIAAVDTYIWLAQIGTSTHEEIEDLLAVCTARDIRQLMPLNHDTFHPTDGPHGTRRLVSVADIAVERFDDGPPSPINGEEEVILHRSQSTDQILRNMAIAWRQGRPTLLQGPASAGKTTLVRFFAHTVGVPMRRVNLSANTDVSDLLGRWVMGNRSADGASGAPKWVDGPVLQAVRYGEVLLLDEINLAPTQVLERLNQLFDDERVLSVQEHHSELIMPHPNFRCFGAMNPSDYGGRRRMSAALQSRWQKIDCPAVNRSQLVGMVTSRFKSLGAPLAERVVDLHLTIETLNLKDISGQSHAPSPRSLLRVCTRYGRFVEGSDAKDEGLLGREAYEIYALPLPYDPDRRKVEQAIEKAFPGASARIHELPKLAQSADRTALGDVEVADAQTGHMRVPTSDALLTWTPRTQMLAYRIVKAWACGEHVALMGAKATGKTAVVRMLAHMLGQPYYRTVLSPDTDVSDLLGSHGLDGWHDGPVLVAGRPGPSPGVMLLDEMNLAPTAVLERFNALLDDDRALVVAENDGEKVAIHPLFRFIAAMNPPTAEYGGRRNLSEALMSRLTLIAVDEPDQAEQRQMVEAGRIRARLPGWVTDTLIAVHTHVAKKSENKAGTSQVSLRDLLALMHAAADLTSSLPLHEAIDAAARALYGDAVDDCVSLKALGKSS